MEPAHTRAFWSKVDRDPLIPGGCWIWTAALNDGYGSFRSGSAHKYAYLAFNGSTPEGLHIHHTCRVRACVNPDHLVALSARDHGLEHAGGTRQRTVSASDDRDAGRAWRRITIHVPDGAIVDRVREMVGPRGLSALISKFLVAYADAREQK